MKRLLRIWIRLSALSILLTLATTCVGVESSESMAPGYYFQGR